MAITVVIPAHNEGAVIGETLRTLLADGEAHRGAAVDACGKRVDESSPAQPFEVLIVCNGCTDDTAAVAREAAEGASARVRILETPIASKTAALNLGLAEARPGTVVCVDADIRLSVGDLLRTAAAVAEGSGGGGGALAASPRARMDLEGSSWPVQAYYRLWLALPYVRGDLMGAGVYALSQAGRERLGALPAVIADDGYVRASFHPRERARVESAVALVRAPRTLRGLVRIKTRSRLGEYQLRSLFAGDLPGRGKKNSYAGAAAFLLKRPGLWACVPVYLYVNALTRARARRQLASLAQYTWERDESSRAPLSPAPRPGAPARA